MKILRTPRLELHTQLYFVRRTRIPALDLLSGLGNNSWRRMPEKNSAKSKRLSRQEVRDLDIKISFMEGIVKRDPRYIEALQILGDHFTQRGRYDHSLKVD